MIGAVERAAGGNAVAMLGARHNLWKAGRPMRYHMVYGYSRMGCEIAGAMGARMGIRFAAGVADSGFGRIDRQRIGDGGLEIGAPEVGRRPEAREAFEENDECKGRTET